MYFQKKKFQTIIGSNSTDEFLFKVSIQYCFMNDKSDNETISTDWARGGEAQEINNSCQEFWRKLFI